MAKIKKPLLLGFLLVLAAAAYWYFAASSKTSGDGAARKAPAPVPVTAAKAETGEMPLMLDIVGRAEAYESVTIKSRVDGQVAKVLYTEGQQVRQGDPLVQLDQGDFQARLLQAESALARDQAQLAKARADVERYVSLKARGFVSDEKVNELRTAEAAAAATVKADEAAVQLARLQLSYTVLKAPFAGIVGARLVFPGTAVKVNDTALAVVNRVLPLYVTFAVPEKHLPRIQRAMAAGPLDVQVSVPNAKAEPIVGRARFIDNAVDPTTGTIQLKALLDNREARLTPGQFLNVSMQLDKLTGTVLVPADAVQQGAEGRFVYVVLPDNKVEMRKVEVLGSYQGKSAIGQGVAAGESVVVDGQLRLAPGATAKLTTPATPQNAAAR